MAAAAEGEDYGYNAFMESVEALAMGRATYDFISGLDPLPLAASQSSCSPIGPRRSVMASPSGTPRPWRPTSIGLG
jgi:hypothetical protein